MNIDRYLSDHHLAWLRLAELTKAARRGPHVLRDGELDELVTGYESVCTNLAFARIHINDAALTARLSTLVSDARIVIYGAEAPVKGRVRAFFATTFPAAVWHARRSILAAMLITFLPAIVMGVWLAHSSDALNTAMPAELRSAYVGSQFENYYSTGPATDFAFKVFTHNTQVAIAAFASGIGFCVVTAWLLAYNGLNVGQAAGVFYAAGQPGKFWGLILPHGILELSAVIVAGAAGLQLGWAIIAPGARRRSDVLLEQGKRSVVIILGLILVFGVAGMIEGYVTGSGLSTPIRVGIGVAMGTGFWSWTMIGGRRARTIHGATGLFDDRDLRATMTVDSLVRVTPPSPTTAL